MMLTFSKWPLLTISLIPWKLEVFHHLSYDLIRHGAWSQQLPNALLHVYRSSRDQTLARHLKLSIKGDAKLFPGNKGETNFTL